MGLEQVWAARLPCYLHSDQRSQTKCQSPNSRFIWSLLTPNTVLTGADHRRLLLHYCCRQVSPDHNTRLYNSILSTAPSPLYKVTWGRRQSRQMFSWRRWRPMVTDLKMAYRESSSWFWSTFWNCELSRSNKLRFQSKISSILLDIHSFDSSAPGNQANPHCGARLSVVCGYWLSIDTVGGRLDSPASHVMST